MKKLIATGLMLGSFLLLSFVVPGSTELLESPQDASKEKALGLLSEYGFFEGPLADLQTRHGILRYALNTPLFSDYALKDRFIVLPEGEVMQWQDVEVFDMPVGTYIVKTFYYQNDVSDATKGRRLIETRLLKHTEKGWVAWPYVWDEAQQDAKYKPLGTKTEVAFVDAQGKTKQINYESPNQFECKSCHSYEGKIRPIGPAARQLHNAESSYVATWTEAGVLEGAPADESLWPIMDWQAEDATVEQAARAYLDANCGYCHRHEGPASTSGLFLHDKYPTGIETGIRKSPVAAGKGSGGLKYDIFPGKPDKSILYYRMLSDKPAVRMPEVGRSVAHEEGLALIREWIGGM